MRLPSLIRSCAALMLAVLQVMAFHPARPVGPPALMATSFIGVNGTAYH